MKKRWIYLLTALTLAVGVCAARPMISGAAPIDLKKMCSMEIFPEYPKREGAFGEDLTKANVMVDLYKVADAEKTPGYDSYSYTLTSDYSGKLVIPDKPTAEDWENLAQKALQETLNGNIAPRAKEIDLTMAEKRTAKGMDAGLYLLVARGSEMSSQEDYKITMRSTDQAVNGTYATIADSEEYIYVFRPELISVPMRGTGATVDVIGPSPDGENGPLAGMKPATSSNAEGGGETSTPGTTEDGGATTTPGTAGNSGPTTADPLDWVYDLKVYLKPVRVPRYGSLEIAKRLEVHESENEVQEGTQSGTGQNEKVTFIFKASWPKQDGSGGTETKMESLTFDGAGEKKIQMHRIPVGVSVTVEEVYTGASSTVVGSAVRTVKVQAEKIKNGIAILDDKNAIKTIISGPTGEGREAPEPEIELEATAAFTNTYDWDQKKGFGINNKFTYDDSGNWIWTSDANQEGEGQTVFNKEISHLEVDGTN